MNSLDDDMTMGVYEMLVNKKEVNKAVVPNLFAANIKNNQNTDDDGDGDHRLALLFFFYLTQMGSSVMYA